ncbi:MAG: FMN-binding negative transcriptional regulator [Pirellulales bacterium]
MYVPASFAVHDLTQLRSFVARHSFATLVTAGDEGPFASHLPMLWRPEGGDLGTLIAHVARANPQWRQMESDRETLAIFHGPHAYISPAWYVEHPSVPTWNYAAVHVYGKTRILHDHDQIVALLRELTATYEAGRESPWNGELPDEYRDKLIQGIVAFELVVTRVEGKFKLGQNRSAEDQQAVYDALSASDDSEQRALAQLMAPFIHVDAE